ncbi:MAG: hypothetical protein GX036_07520 [Firmicutes bacterium]|jgi:hypothetical protein|nr:hypothetical protein [Bacillota bacterium]
MKKLAHIREELRAHLPYTIFSSAFGLIMVGILSFVAFFFDEARFPEASAGLFHIFHPVHVLLSATATTAMFWRHEKKLLKAVLVGLFGSVVICGISDVFIPFISGRILGVAMDLHICLFEHPGIVLPFAAAGVFVGITAPAVIRETTAFSHAMHVFISSMASILYLVSYGLTNWMEHFGMVFFFNILAVLLPCCISDIVFPLLFCGTMDHEAHCPPGPGVSG